MSLHEYKVSQEISARDYPFYALIMAAFSKADTNNFKKLCRAFPFRFQEYLLRYHAPGGILEEELPETIMGRPVKVVVTVGQSHPPTIVLEDFSEYDRRQKENRDGA